jgi:DNA-binding NarL/FixJ family response regulator
MPLATVILADGNVLTREMLALSCERSGIGVVDQVTDMGALTIACEEKRPAVVLVSDPLGDAPAEDYVQCLVGLGSRVVVRTGDASPERITSLLDVGVSGYLLDEMPTERVAEAVKIVAEGAVFLHPAASGTILAQWRQMKADVRTGPRSNVNSLTAREFDVLRAMADGLPTKGIARELGVAPKTVENHKIRVFDKLGARSQAHAVSIAIGHGLLGPPEQETATDELNGMTV